MEPIAEKETTTELAVTITNAIDAPKPYHQDLGGETRKPLGSQPNDLAEIETCAPVHPMPNPTSTLTSRHTPAAKHGRMAAALFMGSLPH